MQKKRMEKKVFSTLFILFLLFSSVTSATAAGITVNLAGGRIGSLEITEQASGSELVLDRETTISYLIVNAPAKIMGQGTVETALVNVNGVSFDMMPIFLHLAEGVTVIIDGEKIGIGAPKDCEASSGSGTGRSRGDMPPPREDDPPDPSEPPDLPDSDDPLDPGDPDDPSDPSDPPDPDDPSGPSDPEDPNDPSDPSDPDDPPDPDDPDDPPDPSKPPDPPDSDDPDDPSDPSDSDDPSDPDNPGNLDDPPDPSDPDDPSDPSDPSDPDDPSDSSDPDDPPAPSDPPDPPLPIQAEFSPTGRVGIVPDHAGEEAGRICAEYKLVAGEGDTIISLAADDVECIEVKYGEGDWEEITANIEGSLWFDIEKTTGNYEFKVRSTEGEIYFATLDWQGEINEIEFQAIADEEKEELETGAIYIKIKPGGVGEEDEWPFLAKEGVKLIAQKVGEKWIKIESDTGGGILWLSDDALWFKMGQEDGIYEFFAITKEDLLYRATLNWQAPEEIEPAKIIQIAAGSNHSLALKSDGTVWAWGRNSFGQLGDGTKTNRDTPVRVKDLMDVQAIAAGSNHSLALKNDGTVWAWGYNENGQLGNGASTAKNVPVRVGSQTCELSDVQAIAAGESHSLALKNDGTIWAWGYNNSGQLGDGTTVKNSHIPVRVKDLMDVKAIAAGSNHSLALKHDGTVWAWGKNKNGQLGLGYCTEENRNTPVQVRSQVAEEQPGHLLNVQEIAAGSNHSLALEKDVGVWAWGYNKRGQLGDGTKINRNTPVQVRSQVGEEQPGYLLNVRAITAGCYHSLAITNDDKVYAWGYNGNGQLGDGTKNDKYIPVQVYSQVAEEQPGYLLNVQAIAAGNLHSLALKHDGTVWAWGYNSNGQLGDGTNEASSNPVQVIFEYDEGTGIGDTANK